MPRLIDLESLQLVSGAGRGENDRFCVMEAASVYDAEAKALKVNGIAITDQPKTVSPVIAAFMRNWNDSLNDEDRQKLKAYIPRVVGTANGAALERKRSYIALDWCCRVSAPTWLRLIGKEAEAKAIEDCAPIVDIKTAKAAAWALQSGAEVARAAGAAAWAAARAAAWDAAGDAAWAAAGAAAWAAARAAARAAAGDPAGAAARAAAGAAARDAAGAAARAAARAALAPTVLALQTSAFALLDRLIEVQNEKVAA